MDYRILIAAAAMSTAAIASADVAISTFTFSDLDTQYLTQDGESGDFVARANAETAGDVTRVFSIHPAETAEYASSFATQEGSMADAVFEMSISNITTNTAEGSGAFTITDVDGDSITGSLEGMWSRAFAGAPILFFNGTLTGVDYAANGDGIFEGTDGSGFELTPFLLQNSFSGGIVQVSFGVDSFFDESFEGFNSQFSGTIVPTPGAFALLLGAGGLISRRRA